MITDRDIIARSREAPEEFGALFDRHAGAVHRFVARQTDAATADDVVAETFLLAFERRGGFQLDRAEARPWLFGIAVNLLRKRARQHARSFRAFSRVAEADVADDDAAAAGDRIDEARELKRVERLLGAMPQKTREPLLLLVWAEFSHQQIAEALDVPIGTVKSRISRARRALGERRPITHHQGDGHESNRTSAALPR